jgi:hypothetical protein
MRSTQPSFRASQPASTRAAVCLRYLAVAATIAIGSSAYPVMQAHGASHTCSLPPRDCTGTTAHCTALVPFTPVTGPGYDNYPLNGETATNQYRSYTRRDLMMLIKYATAVVDCKAAGWTPGNGKPLGLGDMSEADGRTPGSAAGNPGHPRGTHERGRDMDIAYYQTRGVDNHLRAVCPHHIAGRNVNHCTGQPTILDVRRSALFIGTLLTSDRTRVIGVDGRIEPLIAPAMRALCADGTLQQVACNRLSKLASETTNTGNGWYRHHHHHLHIAFKRIGTAGTAPMAVDEDLTIAPGRSDIAAELRRLEARRARGHIIR